MKITNKFDLPQTFVNVVERPTYTKGKAHLSVTELLGSPRITQLRAKYEDQIEVDVSDMVWSIFGSAIHHILEQGQDANHVVEQRIHAEMDGWRLSGAIDLQILHKDGIEINDYKTVGAWGVMNEKIEWEQQLNCYAWLVETVKQIPVTKLGIVAIVRDWNRRDVETRHGYPKAPVVRIDIPLWGMDGREAYIRERVHAHSEALFAAETNQEIPPCTAAECWEKEPVYAVKKDGASRAKSLHSTREEADSAIEKLGKGYTVEFRPGERVRCANYCPVSQWCDQYKEYLNGS